MEDFTYFTNDNLRICADGELRLSGHGHPRRRRGEVFDFIAVEARSGAYAYPLTLGVNSKIRLVFFACLDSEPPNEGASRTRRRYELTDHEWSILSPLLPNRPRGMETIAAWDVPAAGLRAKSTRSSTPKVASLPSV